MKARLLPALLLAASLSACAANPGPPPVEEAEPEPTPTTSSAAPTTTEVPSRRDKIITVGVDPLPAGFNPHLQAHDSTFTRSLGSLVLPSAFRDGAMDTNLLESAGEVEPAPGTVVQTVRYVISPAAQWSDGTPITGADFRYLWQGMTSTAGVIDPAGYRAITDVRTSADGRTVDVDFATHVPDWRELFDHLLPAHVMQGEVARFSTGLDDDIPASGGRYSVQGVDRSRGVVTLHRNDRYWGEDNPEGWGAGILPNALRSLFHYTWAVNDAAKGITSPHAWESNPWSWMPQARPTMFWLDQGVKGCGTSSCTQAVDNLGNPVVWWGGTLALFVLLFCWALRRDWRAGAILAGLAAGYLPWFHYQERTIFGFYAIAFTPWLVLAVSYALGLVLGPRDAPPDRQFRGAVWAGGFVLLSVLLFAYFHPVLAADSIPTADFDSRMWLPGWR